MTQARLGRLDINITQAHLGRLDNSITQTRLGCLDINPYPANVENRVSS